MKKGSLVLQKAVKQFYNIRKQRPRRNWSMSGHPRYQPKELQPFLGYDMWAAWLILVEWCWMLTLAKIGVIPRSDAKYLTNERLYRLLRLITTTRQDEVEKITHHDIIALLELMRKYLPKCLHRWLHYGATSYDIINTAYALQLRFVFQKVFQQKIKEVDALWRKHIARTAKILQAGRTHLQTAMPVTIGFWLSNLHNRFITSARNALELSSKVPGKFTGAVGTSAPLRALIRSKKGEQVVMDMLGLPQADVTTQITPPEPTFRFYAEMVPLSGAMANLGEDVRILQASQFGEIISASSTSSAMPHKTANPIAAENDAGMHVSVIAEFMKPLLTLVSDLQRDLRWSNVMRDYCGVMIYTFQQLKTTERILKTMKINEKRCLENFNVAGHLVVADLLHLALQGEGYPDTHHLVNKVIAPAAGKSGDYLSIELENYLATNPDRRLERAWEKISDKVIYLLHNPHKYLGDAIKIAEREANNKL